jgi:hypothetical protein
MKIRALLILGLVLLLSGCEVTVSPTENSEEVWQVTEAQIPDVDDLSFVEDVPTRLHYFGKGELKLVSSPQELTDVDELKSVEAKPLKALIYRSKDEFDPVGESWAQHVDVFSSANDTGEEELVWRFVALNGETTEGSRIAKDGAFLESAEFVPPVYYPEHSKINVGKNYFGFGPFWLLVKYHSRVAYSYSHGYYLLDRNGEEIDFPEITAEDLLGADVAEDYYARPELIDVNAAPYFGLWERLKLICKYEASEGCVDQTLDVLRYREADLSGEWKFTTDYSEVLDRMTGEDPLGWPTVHEFNAGDELRFFLTFEGECGGCSQTMPSYLMVNETTGRFEVRSTDPVLIAGDYCRTNLQDVLPDRSGLMCDIYPRIDRAHLYDFEAESNQPMKVERSYEDFESMGCEAYVCESRWLDIGDGAYRREWIDVTLDDEVLGWDDYFPL